MTATPHDALVRSILGEPEHAAAELRAVLPPELLAQLDLGSLAVAEGSFVDEALRATSADLLFTVNARAESDEPLPRRVFVYLLLEHQSTPDRSLPLRLLAYMVRIWERHGGELAAGEGLPPIVPVVLHQGPRPWPWSTRFADFVTADATLLHELRSRQVDFLFALDDLATQTDVQLLARGGDAIVRLLLLALRNGRVEPRLASHVAAAMHALRDDLRGPAALRALAQLWSYVLEVGEETPAEAQRAFAAALAEPEGSDSMGMSTADQLRAMGRSEGRTEGRVEARRESLLELLAIKFGAVDAATRARVEQADAEALAGWLRRVVVAPSLADVFAS